MQTIPICFSCDNNYVQHMGVMITSILVNLDKDHTPVFYVLDGGISDANKALLETLKKRRSFEIHYIDMNDARFDWNVCPIVNLPVATYYRLRIPTALPSLDRVLYLDLDMVVDGDIATLWQMDIGDTLMGVVIDPGVDRRFLEVFDIQAEHYFNAGVAVMNLDQMRKENTEQAFFDALEKYYDKIVHSDQDVVNAGCRGHVTWLPPKYNVTHGYTRKHHKPIDLSQTGYTPQELKEAATSPVIVHYIGKRKPWFYTCKHEMADLYWKYLALTPWKDYRFPDKTLKNILWKFFFILRRNIRIFIKRPLEK